MDGKSMLETLTTTHLISLISALIGAIGVIIAARIGAGKDIKFPKISGLKLIGALIIFIFILISSLIVAPILANLLLGPQTTWISFEDNFGSTIKARSISVTQDYPLEISYDLKEWGYVGASHQIDHMILSNLSNTKGIKFFYKGNGEPNSFIVKLEYGDVGMTQFESFIGTTSTLKNGLFLEIPYNSFKCARPETNCECYNNYADTLNQKNVKYITFVMQNDPRKYDIAGRGLLVIDDLQTY